MKARYRASLFRNRRQVGVGNIAVASISRIRRDTLGSPRRSDTMQAENFEPGTPRARHPLTAHAARTGVRRLARRRGIERVYHFTRVENLASIRAHGLLSRSQQAERGIEAVVNDHDRHDGHLDRISASIGFPNTRLLQAWRAIHPSARWAVIVLSPVVLWEHDCLFCPGNAASRRCRAMPTEALRGAAALERLFDRGALNWSAPATREDWPTDIQAEVLVQGEIPASRIACIYFERPSIMQSWRDRLPSKLLRACPRYFGARS